MSQPTEFELSPKHRAELTRANEAAYPRECCGVFLGRSDGTCVTVHRVVSTLNAVSTVGGFAIPDHEMRRVRLLAAEAGLVIVAVFHSHPSGSTELSGSDRAALEHSEWPWVILTERAAPGEVVLTWFNQVT
jgi:proteasome lid subunit RPN8/RPN11